MGSSSSKAAKTAAAAASKRQYPTHPPPPQPSTSPSPAPSHQPGPTVHPQAQASGTKDQAINLDASDTDFARSLRSLGPVSPSPTFSNSSTFSPQQQQQQQQSIFPDPSTNPAIQVLAARGEIAARAGEEFARIGKRGFEGRSFLNVMGIRQVLVMRDQKGLGAREIERRMGLKEGCVERLGGRGVVGDVGGGGG